MKKVLKFVKGRKDERRECGGMTPSQSGDLISPAQTPEDETFSGVDNGYSVDFCGKDKSLTKLHKAAWQGNLEKLKSALKKVEIDAVDRHNRTALHFAVVQGHPNIVWFLLGNNAKTSICDAEGHTPLLKAVECGHKECMTLLLDRGADVNVSDYTGNTGLHIAVGRASVDIASALLKKSADTDVSNNAGDYPLHIATKLENKELVDLLLEAGASVDVLDRENRTPLMLAAKTGNSVLVELFVEKGAQETVVDSNGWTAQDYAMLGGHEHIAGTLTARSHQKTQSPEAESRPEPADSASNSESWGDSQAEASEKEPVSQKLKKIFDKCSEEAEKEDLPESPEAEAIPPYCQPPRSWEIIQAGMIDQKQDGSEPKRRSITALGTLRSRRESFTDTLATSPKSTLSLNRRRHTKEHNAFAKHRFSLNEEASLCHWLEEENKKQKELQEALCDKHSTSSSDWDSVSAEDSKKAESEGSSGTFGRNGTMLGVEELWIANPHATTEDVPDKEKRLNSWDSEAGSPEEEKSFPPPPSGLELGVDMAKSIRSVRGLSVDQSSGRPIDRNLWRNAYESHSLDCLEEKEFERSQSEQFRYQKPRITDVSRRINEQLECYDQALRELAESSKKRDKMPAQNYYSLPSKTGGRDEWRRMSCRENSCSLPPWTGNSNGSDKPDEDKTEKTQKKKRHMLLAMRDVKHALHVTNSFKTSMDDQILSPLAKPEDVIDSDDKSSPRGVSSSSGGNSPADENPFFGMGRQETVLERNDAGKDSEESGTGEESTLWLQDEAQKKENSDDDVPEIAADEGSKHERESSFSPLGVIHREMEEEIRGQEQRAARGEDEEVAEQSPDVSLSSGPIEALGAEKDSGSEPESSHNDLSPTHNYALKSQHEWLKCHLKAATSEKNKLEELTAQLTEKAERLQYELADAKEAAKSRDEVIQLLQGQLARMEAAYTKSLEESVQSRLQLTSHEQEILHLKELCYRYQEEKEAATVGGGGGDLQELQTKIKILEEEKEKMKEEISHLEEEKSILEVRLKTERQEESELMEQCQRWKERCEKLEETLKHCDAKQSAFESYVKEKDGEHLQQENLLREANAALERALRETREENAALKKAAERAEREAEELRRRNAVTEKEMEERIVRKLKEKEEEVGGLVAQFNRERESLLAAHASERRLMERRTDSGAPDEEWRRENERLRQAVQRLRDEVTRLQMQEGAAVAKPIEWDEIVRENVKLLSREVKELKARVTEETEEKEKKKDGRKKIGREGELAWSSLYGMKNRRKEGGRVSGEDAAAAARENFFSEIVAKHERATANLEFLQLKKQILSLESKMSDEKNLRHALENEMLKMRVNMNEKENLEMEVDALKRKVGRHCAGKSGAELLEYEKQLQAKRERYLEGGNGATRRDDYKAKCEALAKEREKSKRLSKAFDGSANITCHRQSAATTSSHRSFSPPRPLPLPHPHPRPPLSLHPDIKNKLDYELDKSIRKHMQDSSIPSVSNVQM